MSDDAGTFSIRVVDADGYGVRGATVECGYGSFSGVGSEYTDDNGWAEFPIIEQLMGGGPIRITSISINGEEVCGEAFVPEDGDTFSYTLP